MARFCQSIIKLLMQSFQRRGLVRPLAGALMASLLHPFPASFYFMKSH